MGSEVFKPRFILLVCLFIEKRELHKLQFFYKIPNCKNCPEDVQQVKKLKQNTLI